MLRGTGRRIGYSGWRSVAVLEDAKHVLDAVALAIKQVVRDEGLASQAIGTVNIVEFFLTVAVSAAFVTALLTGHWEEAEGLATHAWAVAGLIVGGVLAAPLAGHITRIIPARRLMVLVGVIITALATYQIARLL